MDRSIRIVMNPKAGKQMTKTVLFTLCDRFCAMQDMIQAYIIQYVGHVQKFAKANEGYCDILVCVGGDGTWNEAISGITEIDSKPALAYLSSRIANDSAATLKLSKGVGKSMDTIAQYLSLIHTFESTRP